MEPKNQDKDSLLRGISKAPIGADQPVEMDENQIIANLSSDIAGFILIDELEGIRKLATIYPKFAKQLNLLTILLTKPKKPINKIYSKIEEIGAEEELLNSEDEGVLEVVIHNLVVLRSGKREMEDESWDTETLSAINYILQALGNSKKIKLNKFIQAALLSKISLSAAELEA